MLYYNRIDISKEIDFIKTRESKQCDAVAIFWIKSLHFNYCL